MKRRIIWNDIRENRMTAVTTWLFMAVSAFMFALTCFLFVNLSGSVDSLMEKAKTPDYLQMHSGEVSENDIYRFAGESELVRDCQIQHFLNLENSSISFDGSSLADSTQDNGVCVQNESFDFLLDTEDRIISVSDGEIYVPVCYRQKYDLRAGEKMKVGDNEFVIAGFLRDSQMNSMMSSSKRFLVSRSDYNTLQSSGSEEYLIEFLLAERADTKEFAAQYTDAQLPSNGPAVTRPLIRLMNALSDGLMILIIFVAGAVLLLISLLCIRFTLLTQLEEDRCEIGILKAIGISKGDIRRIYSLKFLVLSGLGAVAGLGVAAPVQKIIAVHIHELYGGSAGSMTGWAAASAGVVLTEIILLAAIRRTLKRTEKMSAVEALTGKEDHKSRKKHTVLSQHLIVALVIVLGTFMMVLPQNMLNTISSPEFVTYMGIGNGEIRIDIRQTGNIEEQTEHLRNILSDDKKTECFTALQTSSCDVILSDGSHSGLLVEEGEHDVFPVTYAQGEAPEGRNEIALSCLCAEELEKEPGDDIVLMIDGKTREYTVCGIYSDITNGGKTAKAAQLHGDGPVMWSVFYVALKSGEAEDQWLSELDKKMSDKGISADAVDIQEYVTDTYGQTIQQVKTAVKLSILAAVMVIFAVVVLFTRLLVAGNRNDISLRKAIGFRKSRIKVMYILRYVPVVIAGIAAGVLSGTFLGEELAGIVLSRLGAGGFSFITDFKAVCVWIPGIALVSVFSAILLGLHEINNIRAYECCTGKE